MLLKDCLVEAGIIREVSWKWDFKQDFHGGVGLAGQRREPLPELCTEGGLREFSECREERNLSPDIMQPHQATTERHGAVVHVLLSKGLRGILWISLLQHFDDLCLLS